MQIPTNCIYFQDVHVMFYIRKLNLLAFALCYVDDFVLFKFYLFFIRVTDLIIFHANTDTIFFLIILKSFLYSTHFLLYMYHVFFFKYYVIFFFFINEHLIFLFMLYYLQFILEVITNNLMCKIAILWVHVSP